VQLLTQQVIAWVRNILYEANKLFIVAVKHNNSVFVYLVNY
jgi:hypothetical protein